MISINSLLKLLGIMLFIICLITYFIPAAEGHLVLSNISDLYSNMTLNSTSAELNNTNLDRALRGATQAIDSQIPRIDTTSHDIFYGVSRAAPGTFQIMVQRWYLRMLSRTTTPATWTTPITSSTSTATNVARTVGMRTLLSGFIFISWIIGSIISLYK